MHDTSRQRCDRGGEAVNSEEWLAQLRASERYQWCSDDQWECCLMLFNLVGGEHHLYSKVKEWGFGVEVNVSSHRLSTFDFSRLTTAVFMAHDRCIRFEIGPSGPGRVRWILHKRHHRDGPTNRRHPTISEALETYRQSYPEEAQQ